MTLNYCIGRLRELTGKRNIFFTDRGNSSILLSLKIAKSLGKKRLFLQDQGGWITYGQYGRQLKYDISGLETDYGLILVKKLEGKLGPDSVLLMNSMPGYFALQGNMKIIANLCKKENSLLINDVSGSIGQDDSRYGDLIVGSFGEWKPLEVGRGGFIAYDNAEYFAFFKENFKKAPGDIFSVLRTQLNSLPQKTKGLYERQKTIKVQLKEFDIIHRSKKGFNVIIKHNDDGEKKKILDFCKLNGYEFTFCPRYIRVLEQAISIEVKRK